MRLSTEKTLITDTPIFIWLVTAILCSRLEGNCPLLHSANRAPNIDRYTPYIWSWPLTLTPDLDIDLWPRPRPLALTSKQGKYQQTVISRNVFSIWPWPLTYDIDLQSQLSSTYILKIKVLGQTVQAEEHGWTDGHSQVHYLPALLKLRRQLNYLMYLITC